MITRIDFPLGSYVKQKTTKNQIVLHHTVSGPGIRGDISTWVNNPNRIATHFIISRDGIINQLFDVDYFAYHIGVKNRSFLDKHSIGIELDSWGPLIKDFDLEVDRFLTVYGSDSKLPTEQVVRYPNDFRGYEYFEKYTEQQLSSTKWLINHLGFDFTVIPNPWELSQDALNGKRGIYSHTNYRLDKSDIHPQFELIELCTGIGI